MQTRTRLSGLLLFASVAFAGCGGPQAVPDAGMLTCGGDTRGQTYVPGLSEMGKSNLIAVKLESSDPAPPLKGNNDWVIDVSDADGKPVAGAQVEVMPFMPDHGHGTPIKVAVTDMGGGRYKLSPLNLFMAGLWQVTIKVTMTAPAPDGSAPGDGGAPTTSDYVVYDFCIEG